MTTIQKNIKSSSIKGLLPWVLSLVFVMSYNTNSIASERDAVIETIHSAYVEGFQNLGGRELMEAGFHETFVMVLNRSGQLSELPLERMIEIVERRQSNPDYQHIEVEARILDVDITGNAAMVKLELYREGKLLFTDYLGLYKFDGNWKIFNKLYHQH